MKAILGGGISALIFAFYNKDYFVLSEQIGGQMNSSFDLGPRYLHNKPCVIDFLKSLDIPVKESKIRVGYLDDSGWVENPNLEFRQKYYMKSRGVKDLTGFDPTVLNTNMSEFPICEVDFKNLILKLFEKVADRIYGRNVDKIDLVEQRIYAQDLTFKYDKLVSTIPLNIFSKLANLNIKLESTSMAYCLVPEILFDLKQFDYVYDNRSDTCFHRMTRTKRGIVCDVLEENLEIFKQVTSLPYTITILKNSQIISLEKDFELSGHPEIRFLGRYGAWHRRFKTETVIEEAQNV